GCAASQVRVMESDAEVSAQDYRRDARVPLQRPGQGPFGFDAPGRVRPDAACDDLPGAKQQVLVNLAERAARVRVDQRHRLAEELLFLTAGAGAEVSAVMQIGEMAQQRACLVLGRYWHLVPGKDRLSSHRRR